MVFQWAVNGPLQSLGPSIPQESLFAQDIADWARLPVHFPEVLVLSGSNYLRCQDVESWKAPLLMPGVCAGEICIMCEPVLRCMSGPELLGDAYL